MNRVAVVGIGHSRFGRRTDVNVGELAFESIKGAFDDAGVDKNDIKNVVVGTMGAWSEELLPAVTINEYAGLSGAGTMRVEAACASGSAALKSAYSSVASGEVDLALALGVEKMTEIDSSTSVELIGRAGSYTWEFENYGITFPAYYALYAVSHMSRYGTTEEDLSRVAVKAHHYGAMNPLAQFQKEITLEKAMGSQVIAWPLKLYDACPLTDGSAAVVLASEEKAKELTDTPIWIKGVGHSSDTANLSRRSDYVGLSAVVTAAKNAYAMAKVSAEDIDVATAHDCFTIAELMAYEDLGFCRKGEAAKMIRDGETELGGRIPVNVDGGLKAKGHPVGATGVSMAVEITKQLRGEAGKRQANIRNGLGLVHNVGGTGHYAYVTILSRS
jgi:acetyl-CoA C-acetyltransferase